MPNYQYVVGEILRVRETIFGVQQEIQTLRNSVRAYRGWTTRYRRRQKELEQTNLVICRERDEARRKLQELQIRQQELLEAVREAGNAVEDRDRALSQLEEVINKIEQYREICDRFLMQSLQVGEPAQRAASLFSIRQGALYFRFGIGCGSRRQCSIHCLN